VDVTRLPIPQETRPKSVTFTFIDSGTQAWTITVDIIDHDGTTHHSSLRTTLDGTPAAIVGSTEADVGAAKMPEPGVLILMLAKGQMPASTRVYTVDADGKRMLETATFFGDKGQPMMRTNYFSRIEH
jgi:hypothetical protein